MTTGIHMITEDLFGKCQTFVIDGVHRPDNIIHHAFDSFVKFLVGYVNYFMYRMGINLCTTETPIVWYTLSNRSENKYGLLFRVMMAIFDETLMYNLTCFSDHLY
jgi:hypothetical protein